MNKKLSANNNCKLQRLLIYNTKSALPNSFRTFHILITTLYGKV